VPETEGAGHAYTDSQLLEEAVTSGEKGGGNSMDESSLALDESFIPRFVLPGDEDGDGRGAGMDFGSTLPLCEGLSPIFQNRPSRPASPAPSFHRQNIGRSVSSASMGSSSSSSSSREDGDVEADLSRSFERSVRIGSDGALTASQVESQTLAKQRVLELQAQQICSGLTQEGVVAKFSEAYAKVHELQEQLAQYKAQLDDEPAKVAAVVKLVAAEAVKLVRSDSPLSWEGREEISSYFELDILERANRLQTSCAPVLSQILSEGVLNRAAEAPGTARYSSAYYARGLLACMASLLKLRSERTSFLPSLNSMYMMAHRASKVLYGYFNRQGVCDSYDTANRSIQRVKCVNAQAARAMMVGGQWAHTSITADNINMYARKVEQRADSRSHMLNATVACVAPISRVDPSLEQLAPQVGSPENFDVDHLSPSQSDHAVMRAHAGRVIHQTLQARLSKSFVECPAALLDLAAEQAADRELLPAAVGASGLNFQTDPPLTSAELPRMLPLIPVNEAETVGMIEILDYLRGRAEHADPEGHTTRKQFFHGDQLTVKMLQTAQKAQDEGPESRSQRSIQSMQYFFGILGYFHFRWANLALVMDQFWGGVRDVGSLCWFRAALGGRTHAGRDAKIFYPCQAFLQQVLQAYILGRSLVAIRVDFPGFCEGTLLTPGALQAAGFADCSALLQRVVQTVVEEIYSSPPISLYASPYVDKLAYLRSDRSIKSLIRECLLLQYARDGVRRGDGIAMLRFSKFSLTRFIGYGAGNYAQSTCKEYI